MCWNYPQTPPGAIPPFVIRKCWHEKQESAQSTPCRHLHGALTDIIEEWILVLNQAFAVAPAGSRAGQYSISPPKTFQSFHRLQVGSRVFDSPWNVQQFMKHVPLPFEEDAGWGQMCHTAPQKNPSSVSGVLERVWRRPLRAGSQTSHHDCVSSCTLATQLHLHSSLNAQSIFCAINKLW